MNGEPSWSHHCCSAFAWKKTKLIYYGPRRVCLEPGWERPRPWRPSGRLARDGAGVLTAAGAPDGPRSALWGGPGERWETSRFLVNKATTQCSCALPSSRCPGGARPGPSWSHSRDHVGRVHTTSGGLAVALQPGVCFQTSWGWEEAAQKLLVLFAPPRRCCLPRLTRSRSLGLCSPAPSAGDLPQGQRQGSVQGGRRKSRAGWHWRAQAPPPRDTFSQHVLGARCRPGPVPDVPLWGSSLPSWGLRPGLTRGPARLAGGRHW